MTDVGGLRRYAETWLAVAHDRRLVACAALHVAAVAVPVAVVCAIRAGMASIGVVALAVAVVAATTWAVRRALDPRWRSTASRWRAGLALAPDPSILLFGTVMPLVLAAGDVPPALAWIVWPAVWIASILPAWSALRVVHGMRMGRWTDPDGGPSPAACAACAAGVLDDAGWHDDAVLLLGTGVLTGSWNIAGVAGGPSPAARAAAANVAHGGRKIMGSFNVKVQLRADPTDDVVTRDLDDAIIAEIERRGQAAAAAITTLPDHLTLRAFAAAARGPGNADG